ncbi:MAG: alpha-D-ribose 1-methylphosphonate 5-phosphate C-P-lyase PhnJ [Deltaproteobacteria bacterium]|jgi:alpha-D-ribose 1-methylphosphonate 5-phosphate C-P lyase|nr:alpha-D-ribose 1-methylphosphonate 5-phosphate C-P-lyase PhnJ [Deltaproteobacteria bacterium]
MSEFESPAAAVEQGGGIREILARRVRDDRRRAEAYNFAYLDEDTKREIRRALLKAVAVPGYQVPFAGREMPMPYGWGTGGIQVTASIIGPEDVLKVIDQGSDDTTNAVSIRAFHRALTGVATTTATAEATIVQTRHRIPETPLKEGQIMVYQVPLPEPMRPLEPSEFETRTLHALEEYGTMYLRLYEDVSRHKEIAISYDYPIMVAGRHAASPSPIPRFDNPKLDLSPALHLFGAGRERRVYAIPPYTTVRSFDFSDHPFRIQSWDRACAICGSGDSYLDEIVVDDEGGRMFVCSDSDHCQGRLGPASGPVGTGRGGKP